MNKAKLALIGVVFATAMLGSKASAQSGYWHNFCMSQASYACQQGDNLGYPYFSACGQALYEICMVENGQGTFGGGGVYIPNAPTCYPTGRVQAGDIENPEEQCQA